MKKVIIAAVIFMLMAGAAQAFPNEPDGFQFWKFGMPFEEAEPWLELVEKSIVFGYTTYKPQNSSFFGSGIELKVSFYMGKLVAIEFEGFDTSFGDVWLEEFIKRFGEPTDADNYDNGGFFHAWNGDKAVVWYVAQANTKSAVPYQGKYSKIAVYMFERNHYDLMISMYEYKGW